MLEFYFDSLPLHVFVMNDSTMETIRYLYKCMNDI